MNIIELINQEICNLEGYILRFRSVGAYQDNCQRWAFYIEAYRKLLHLIADQPISLDNQPNRATQDDHDYVILKESAMNAIPDLSTIAKEKLHPSLRRRLSIGFEGIQMLKHPLLVQPYFSQHDAIYNRCYHDKLKEVKQAKAAHNWAKIIWLHERMFRANALEGIASAMPDDQYWRLLAEVWIDAENIHEERAAWLRLWTAQRAQREQVMTVGEHDALAILPEVSPGMVAIYRGCRDRGAASGMSWAVSRTQAEWFAQRHASEQRMPLLVTAVIRKRDIQAYFLDRVGNEAEIVALPKDCQSLAIETLPLQHTG